MFLEVYFLLNNLIFLQVYSEISFENCTIVYLLK